MLYAILNSVKIATILRNVLIEKKNLYTYIPVNYCLLYTGPLEFDLFSPNLYNQRKYSEFCHTKLLIFY